MNAWRIVELLGVLSDETRFQIVAMLVQAGDEGMPQNRIGARTGLALPRLKRHLARLVKAGLVRRNHRRKGVVWKIDERQLGGLVEGMAAKLKPQLPSQIGPTVTIEAPSRFRTLASKLSTVTPASKSIADGTRRRLARSLPPPERRLPGRLSEAIARQTGRDEVAVASTVLPEPQPEAQAPSTSPPQLQIPDPAPTVQAEPKSRERRHPVRLSDAIAEVSG